jgi:hypothetical protein
LNTNSSAWQITDQAGVSLDGLIPYITLDAYDFTDVDFAGLVGQVSNPN